MEKFRGTKGKWIVKPNSHFIEVIREENFGSDNNDNRLLTANVMLYAYDSFDDKHLSEENYANAHLMAAAPELLEALQEMNEWCKSLTDSSNNKGDGLKPIIDKADKAINKALIIKKQ